MGGYNFTDEEYARVQSTRAATKTPTFAHTAAVAAKPRDQWAVHPSMNPFGVKRECRDSDVHPNSRGLALGLDVTGSMDAVPRLLQEELCKLMALFTKRNILPDVAILTAAIGDAYTDRVPLQVGQFESGIQIENDLTNLFLEKGGGGQDTESYNLFMYFLARHTVLDCWGKRQQKAFAFIIGDESYEEFVNREHVARVIGDDLKENISTADICKELCSRYETFFIMPNQTHHYGNDKICNSWRKLLGERFIKLDNPLAICELIVGTVGLMTTGDMATTSNALKSAGTDLAVVGAVESALAEVARVHAKTGVEMTLAGSGAGSGIATL